MPIEKHGPLKGIKVVELCHAMAGPTCGLMLADMGADVVKLEKIDKGDDTRRFVPPDIAGESAAFMMMNRNKRGIVVNLKTDGGRAVLARMLATADVVSENYRPGVMDRLGFDYESLRATNPGLIYASITGFGSSGPYARRAGLDLIAQGMSGLMSITGEGPGRPPVKVGAPVCDITAGLLLAMGVLAALHERGRTGRGQKVETSLFEAGITHTYWQSAIAFATDESPTALGSAHPLSAPYQAMRTSDGYVTLGGQTPKLWRALCELLGDMALHEDPRFHTNEARMHNLPALIERLEPLFAKRSTAAWLADLEKAGIPAGPVYDVRQMQQDPHTIARDMVPTVTHPVAGPMQTIGLPIKFADTPGRVTAPAPLFGQHTVEVLAEYGFGEADVRRFLDEGAIVVGEPPAARAAG